MTVFLTTKKPHSTAKKTAFHPRGWEREGTEVMKSIFFFQFHSKPVYKHTDAKARVLILPAA